MSLISGAVSFVEFSVPVDTVFDEDKVRPLVFIDIDDTYHEYSIGWVSPFDMFSTGQPAVVLGDYVILTMRVDQRKAPAAILKKLVAKEERRVKTERQVPKLSRSMRVEIKERIKTELIRKTKPTTVTVDVVWSVNTGRVLFFSVAPSMLELFEDLFQSNFGCTPQLVPVPEAPGDFLAWCWWKSGVITLDGRMSIGEGPEQQVVCAEGPEAFKALALGKAINQAHVLVENYGKGALTSGLVFKGFKLPTVTSETVDDGLILERIHLVEELIGAVRGEFDSFLTDDTDGFNNWVLEQSNS